MFGLGFSEIITIVIVIIVFINPKDLPLIVRKIGVIYGKIMRQINGVRKIFSDYEQELKSLEKINSSGKSTSRKEIKNHIRKGEKK